MISYPKIRNYRSKICSFLPILGIIFDHLGCQKSRFLDFFKVVLELFEKFLSFVFGLKKPTFDCMLSYKGRYISTKIEISCQKFANFGRFKGSFLTILGVKKVVFWSFTKLIWTFLGSFEKHCLRPLKAFFRVYF